MRERAAAGVFEQFTVRARRVVVQAHEKARSLDRDHAGTEHILLALSDEGGSVAAKVLTKLDISLLEVRRQAEQVAVRGSHAQPSGHIPYAADAVSALDLSVAESRDLGHRQVGTGHVLLGLIRQGDGLAAQILTSQGADLERVRQQVRKLGGRKRGLLGRLGFTGAASV